MANYDHNKNPKYKIFVDAHRRTWGRMYGQMPDLTRSYLAVPYNSDIDVPFLASLEVKIVGGKYHSGTTVNKNRS